MSKEAKKTKKNKKTIMTAAMKIRGMRSQQKKSILILRSIT